MCRVDLYKGCNFSVGLNFKNEEKLTKLFYILRIFKKN